MQHYFNTRNGIILIVLISVFWINMTISNSTNSLKNSVSASVSSKLDGVMDEKIKKIENKLDRQKVEINLNSSDFNTKKVEKKTVTKEAVRASESLSIGEKGASYSIIGSALKASHERHEASKGKVLVYINKYKNLAIEEYKLYGILPSITLAQALLESNVGESRLAKSNNAHFGQKCFSKNCKKGHCSNYTDDTHKDFFVKFKSVWFSYRSHSQFLQRKRYERVRECNSYKCQAIALKKCGYATDRKYHKTLIKIIEAFDLQKYDTP